MKKYSTNNGYTYHSSEYKGVFFLTHHTRKTRYGGQILIGTTQKRKSNFKTEREAAKWVDMQLIRAGKEPINVLKRM